LKMAIKKTRDLHSCPLDHDYRTCRTNHFTDTDKSFKDRFNQFYTVVKVFGGLNPQVTTFEKLSYNSCRSKEVFNVDAISSE
jgi:hypothetical protein